MEIVRVTERPPAFDLVRWDGTAEAEAWLTERFGEQGAVFSGEEGNRTFTMWGSWVIPVGDYVIERWGGFNYVPAAQVQEQWQAAAPALELESATPPEE